METFAGIEVRWVWALLFSGTGGVLEEPKADYGGMLERMEAPDGAKLPLRPLVKALFILFLRHPEGILLKQREMFRRELEEIYGVISPNTEREDVSARVGRLVNLQDNSFSEKASVLNARLEALLPGEVAEQYKIQGYNGHPRKIPLDPLLVNWE